MFIARLTAGVVYEARSYMHEVKKGLNWMLNLIREEAEESVATAWKSIEAERDHLQELQTKTMVELQLCQGQMMSQTEMLKTANEETARLREELVVSGSY